MQPDRPVQTTLAFHASRIVIDVGVLIAMASMSMPFVTAPGGDRGALAADAFPAVLLLLPIFVVTLIPDHTRPLHPALGWGALVLALAALPYAFVKMLDASILAETLGGSVGIGPAVLLIGCIVTIIGIGIGLVRTMMGRPSGGTPGRTASYRTTRAPKDGGTRQTATTQPAPARAAAGAAQRAEEPTRLLGQASAAEPGSVAPAQPEGDEAPPPRREEVRPRPAQPEIVFPDTTAVAREADSEPEPADDTMDTAERADAALTDHLSWMFEEEDDDPPRDES